MNKLFGRKNIKKNNAKSNIIKRQVDEIERLKNKISELEIDRKEKDDLINSVNSLRYEFLDVINELKNKGKKYDELISDLTNMKKIMNQKVFKGRWRLIRFLLK